MMGSTSKIIGEYQLLEMLWHDTTKLYLGRHLKTRNDHFITVISKKDGSSSIDSICFKQQAQKLTQLQHPNILGVLDFGETEDGLYLVRNYVQSESLADWLGRQQEPLSLSRIATLMAPVLNAFSHAHHLGFVHRDINLDNLYITRAGQIFVHDFGLLNLRITCIKDQGTTIGRGNVLYSSPEQLKQEPVIDYRSDLYVLGVVLYRLLTGQDLFLGHAPFAIALQHITATPLSPRFFIPGLPNGAEQALLKSLQKAPEERYQSAQDMAEMIATHFHMSDREIRNPNSANSEQPWAGLSMNLYRRVRRAIFERAYSTDQLRTLFDNRRISVWREPLFEQFNSDIPWVDTTINFLAKQHASDPYENGLSRLLQVLSDNVHKVYREDLRRLAAEIVAG